MKGRRITQRARYVDTSRTLRFRFDGHTYQGHPGDTLASALLANGVRLLARSFKYGRPRGVIGAGADEPNVLVQLESGAHTIPNLKATQVELYEGLSATRTSGWPSLRFDVKSLAGLFARFMPAGFYSKTFKWPVRFWPYYEKIIRAAAGYGHAPTVSDPDHYDHLHHHTQVLIVGAGLAGLVAARCAGEAGLKTLLIDEQSEPGGWLLAETNLTIDGVPAEAWLQTTLAELQAMGNVTVLTRTCGFGLYDNNLLLAVESLQDHLPPAERNPALPRQRQHKIRAEQIVLATGAIDRPLVFGNNDRPGVMTIAGALTMLNRFGVVVGERVVLVGGDDRIYDAAAELGGAGARITIVDLRPEGSKRRAPAGATIHRGYGIDRVLGRSRVRGVLLRKLVRRRDNPDAVEALAGAPIRVRADAVVSSAGLVPTVHLFCHDGSKPVWQEAVQAFVIPPSGRPGIMGIGAVTGAFEWQDTLEQTGQMMARLVQSFDVQTHARIPRMASIVRDAPLPIVRIPDGRPEGSGAKAFVDFQNDVTAADIELAVRENYQSIEHVKRYTALGFGTDQGKLSNVNGFILTAQALGQPVSQIGTTTYRPAYTPVSFGALAGAQRDAGFDPVRLTSLHPAHLALNACFEPVGQWLRPLYYPQADETMAEAVARECLAVRRAAGLMDASTLGKIQVDGPDAREFLNRIYCTGLAKLAPGHCRYGLMLDENGMVMDDGVVACINEQSFALTTTTGGAAHVLAWMESWLQTEWPQLQVFLSSTTERWAALALAGPRSRDVLQKLNPSIDLSASAFPFMTWRDGKLGDTAVRLMRVSFSGELAFEIHLEADAAPQLWQTLLDQGAAFGLTPYGTEAMHVLRAEKGFIIVGQDTDGSVTPMDLGMQWAVAKSKPFSALGVRSLARADTSRADRKQLVGLLTEPDSFVLGEGAQLVETSHPDKPAPSLGHVTSSYMSAALGHSIALALLERGRERIGETIFALDHGIYHAVRIVSPVFYDPDGSRHHD